MTEKLLVAVVAALRDMGVRSDVCHVGQNERLDLPKFEVDAPDGVAWDLLLHALRQAVAGRMPAGLQAE